MRADTTDNGRDIHPTWAAGRAAANTEIPGTRAPAAVDKGTRTLLTAAQLAERWQVPVRTVYAWAKRNAIPHYRAGRLLRFDPVEVAEHFRRHGFANEVAAHPDHLGNPPSRC